jgi:hypothetical protein
MLAGSRQGMPINMSRMCFRSFFMRSRDYLNRGMPSAFSAEEGQARYRYEFLQYSRSTETKFWGPDYRGFHRALRTGSFRISLQGRRE